MYITKFGSIPWGHRGEEWYAALLGKHDELRSADGVVGFERDRPLPVEVIENSLLVLKI